MMEMNASAEEILQYVREEDVKFIRLAFCDVYGRQKNISVMPSELERAFVQGIAIDGSAIAGFGDVGRSELFLHPDASTIAVLPWRPEHGRVVRMFCSVTHADGMPLHADCRTLLQTAIQEAEREGISFSFSAEQTFYLFQCDENGAPTDRPFDQAGYMDIAPEDRGENVRREICLTLERMGIQPQSSHHEAGPGQNKIVFHHADPLCAADQTVTFQSVVRTVAARNGLHADFSPCPVADKSGNHFHVHFSAKSRDGRDVMPQAIAGILKQIPAMTLFLNPQDGSYARGGDSKVPMYISWGYEDRTSLIRIPASFVDRKHAELRSPDPTANPYLVFTLLIYACLYGIREELPLPAVDGIPSADKLPSTLSEAKLLAEKSPLIYTRLPNAVVRAYLEREDTV